MRILLLVSIFMLSCSPSQTEVRSARDVPDVPVVRLPDPPEEVPEGKRQTFAVSECLTEEAAGVAPRKVGPGIMMSPEMAMRAARVKVAYDEMRGLYEVDLRTAGREREVYERIVENADEEAALWRGRSERSWIERNGWWVGMVGGVVLGAATAVGLAAALDAALAD